MEEKVVCETYLSIPKINEQIQKLNELKKKQAKLKAKQNGIIIKYDSLNEHKNDITNEIISMLDDQYNKKPIRIMSDNKTVEYYGWLRHFSKIDVAMVRVLIFPWNDRAKVATNDYTYNMSKIVFVSDDEINDYIIRAIKNTIIWNV